MKNFLIDALSVIEIIKITWTLQQVIFISNTWSETYFRQDLFPTYLFFRGQFNSIMIFRLKSISDLDSGSLPIFFLVNSYTQNQKSWSRNKTGREIAQIALANG